MKISRVAVSQIDYFLSYLLTPIGLKTIEFVYFHRKSFLPGVSIF